ncbi:MAG: sugar-binding protein [Planctomycetota bacterium]|jgi:hypothetical protein
MKKTTLFISLILFVVTLSAQADNDVPQLKAVKTAAAPVLDGELKEDIWKNAAVATSFRASKTGKVLKVQTTVYFLYDNNNIYLGVKCQEPEPDKIKAHKFENEREIWQDDIFAVFIKPDNRGRTYYQFALNVEGGKFDQQNTDSGVFYEKFSPDWKYAAVKGKDFWSAEVIIPFSSIGITPQMGQTWRMNFCRSRKADKILSSWAQVFNWHDYQGWGKIRNLVIGETTDKSVVLSNINLQTEAEGKKVISAYLENISDKDLTLKGKIITTSPSGDKKSVDFAVPGIAAGKGAEISVPAELKVQEGIHLQQIELSSAGKIVYKSPPGQVNMAGLLDCYVERSYYASEKEAAIACLVSPELSKQSGVKLQLVCTVAGTSLSYTADLAESMKKIFTFPISSLANKIHTVKVTLKNGSDILAQREKKLYKHSVPQGNEVKILRRDKGAVILFNGKRFITIGNLISHYELKIHNTDTLKEMKDSGFNSLITWRGGIEDALRTLDTAHKYGLLAGVSLDHLYSIDHTREDLLFMVGKYHNPSENEPIRVKKIREKIKTLQDSIKRLKTHPALLFWFNIDEPGIKNMPAVRLLTQIVREVDPYHPIEVGCGPPATGLKYKLRSEAADIYGTHTYLHGNRPMITPYDRARRASSATDLDRKVHANWLTGSTSWSYRGLTAIEQRTETYLGIIGGWRNIKWFRGRHQYLECWNSVKKVAGELKVLTNYLTADEVKQNITAAQPEIEPVKFHIFEFNGKRCLIAANSTGKDVGTVSFNIPTLKDGTTVKVLFENRQIRAEGSLLKDNFAAKATHIYEF